MSKKTIHKPGKTTTVNNYTAENKFDFYNNKKFHYLIILISTLLLYGWTYTFKYNLDDDYILDLVKNTENNFDGIREIFTKWFANADYRPINILSFWIERFIFNELSANISHLMNVLIYSFLLMKIYDFIIVSKFIEDTKALTILALLSTLIFLVHPNHVSVVANIKSRDNLLSMLFGILASIQLIKLYDYRQYWRIPLFFIFITLGLLSKFDCVVFIIIPAFVLFLFRNVNKKRIATILIVTFLLLIISLNLRGYFVSQLNQDLQLARLKVTDNPLLFDHSFTSKLSLTLTSLYYYLKFLLIPFGYYFFYGYKEITILPLFSFTNTITFIAFLLISIISIYNYNKNRIYLFCWIFFGLSILYALNFFTTISGIVSDRYNFIASLAFCIAFASVLQHFVLKNELAVFFKNKFVLFVLLFYSFFTIYRTADWKDEFTLYEHDLPHIPNSLNAYRIAAGTYIHKALEEEMKPNFNKTLADDYINKGEQHALTALSIYNKSAEVWELLGLCATYKKNYTDAVNKFSNCFTSDSTYLSGINYLGFAYWNINKTDSAMYYFNFVMHREPLFNYSANNMINLLDQRNRYRELDSLLIVLKNKFPDDDKLKKKIENLNKNRPVLFPVK